MGPSVQWNRFSADPRQGEVAGIRATDVDREIALDVLREAYADGRLDRGEYEQRSSQALEVRLLGQFVPLLLDLEPPLPATLDVHEQALAKYHREGRDARRGFVAVIATTLAIWGASSLATGGLMFFWPIFPMVGVGIGWFMHRLNRGPRIEELERRITRRALKPGQDDDSAP